MNILHRIANRMGAGYQVLRTKRWKVVVWHAMRSAPFHWETWKLGLTGRSYNLTIAPFPHRHSLFNIYICVERNS